MTALILQFDPEKEKDNFIKREIYWREQAIKKDATELYDLIEDEDEKLEFFCDIIREVLSNSDQLDMALNVIDIVDTKITKVCQERAEDEWENEHET